eukprot:3556775-Lingulodinium_polyedra.AAC.1
MLDEEPQQVLGNSSAALSLQMDPHVGQNGHKVAGRHGVLQQVQCPLHALSLHVVAALGGNAALLGQGHLLEEVQPPLPVVVDPPGH